MRGGYTSTSGEEEGSGWNIPRGEDDMGGGVDHEGERDGGETNSL